MGDKAAEKIHERESGKPRHDQKDVKQFSEQADDVFLTSLIALERDPVTKEIYKELRGYIKPIEAEREKIERAQRIYDNALDKYAAIKEYQQDYEKYHSKVKSSISEAYVEARIKRAESLGGIVALQENFINKDPENKDKRVAAFTLFVGHVLHIDGLYSVEQYRDLCKAERDELLYMRWDIYRQTADRQYKKYFDEYQEKSSSELKQNWNQKIDSSLGTNRPMDTVVAKSINKTFASRLRQLYEFQVSDNPIDAYKKCEMFIDDLVRLNVGGRGTDLPLRQSDIVLEMIDDYARKASILRDDIVQRNPMFTECDDRFVLLRTEAQPFLQSVELLAEKIRIGERPSEYLMEKWVYPTANNLLKSQHLQFIKTLVSKIYDIDIAFPNVGRITDRFSTMLSYCQKLEKTATAVLEIKGRDNNDNFMLQATDLLKKDAKDVKNIEEISEVSELIDKIREQYGFNVIYNIAGMAEGYVGSEEVVDISAVSNALKSILRSLRRYPPSLIKYFKMNAIGGDIKNIYLTSNLRGTTDNGRQYNCSGFALTNGDIVIDLSTGEEFFAFIFHHEFFHQLDHSDTYERDNENWVKQNIKGVSAYKYKSGGEANADGGFSFSDIVDVFLGKNSEDLKGFAESYGMRGGVEEDQATIGENLISGWGFSIDDLLERAATDLVLRKKIEITTGCQFNPATQRFSRLLTREEYKAKYGYDDYEYYAKWSRDYEGRIWMDHNYWNAVADGKPMIFEHH